MYMLMYVSKILHETTHPNNRRQLRSVNQENIATKSDNYLEIQHEGIEDDSFADGLSLRQKEERAVRPFVFSEGDSS